MCGNGAYEFFRIFYRPRISLIYSGLSLHAQSLFIKVVFLILCLGSIVNTCTYMQFFPWIFILPVYTAVAYLS